MLRECVDAGLARQILAAQEEAALRTREALRECVAAAVSALEAEARAVLPWMTKTLARDAGARWRVDWLAGE